MNLDNIISIIARSDITIQLSSKCGNATFMLVGDRIREIDTDIPFQLDDDFAFNVPKSTLQSLKRMLVSGIRHHEGNLIFDFLNNGTVQLKVEPDHILLNPKNPLPCASIKFDAKLINAVTKFASTDRPDYSGIGISYRGDNKVVAIATNGHRLASMIVGTSNSPFEAFTLKGDTLLEICKVFKLGRHIHYNNGVVTSGNSNLIYHVQDDKVVALPDMSHLFEFKYPTTIHVNPKTVVSLVKPMDTGRAGLLAFSLTEEQGLRVTNYAKDHTITIPMVEPPEGEPGKPVTTSIGINKKYMLDSLSALSHIKSVEIELFTSLSPLRISWNQELSDFMLIMPMRAES